MYRSSSFLSPRFRDCERSGLLLGWKLPQTAVKAAPGFLSASSHQQHPLSDEAEAIWLGGESHILTLAPTSSGKGVGGVIPALLCHPGQVIVIDPKGGEAYQVTARWRRQMGQQVIRIDPWGVIDPTSTDALNPLDLLDLEGMHPEDDVRSLVELLVGEQKSISKDVFWDNTAGGLIAGQLAWLAKDVPSEERRLSKIREMFGGDDFVYQTAVLLDGKSVTSKIAREEFSIFLQHPERDTRGGVQSTASQHFRLFGSERVRRATDRSTFSLKDLVDGKPMSIYLIVPPSKLESHRSLLRLWLGTLLWTLSTRKTQPASRTLIIADEAGNLGSLGVLQQAVTLFRAYGVSVWSFFQDASQLQQLYPTSWPAIVNNCSLQIFGARNQRMANEYASLVGGITGEEVMALAPDQQLLLLNGGRPIISRRVNYLTDAVFQGRYDHNAFYSVANERTIGAL